MDQSTQPSEQNGSPQSDKKVETLPELARFFGPLVLELEQGVTAHSNLRTLIKLRFDEAKNWDDVTQIARMAIIQSAQMEQRAASAIVTLGKLLKELHAVLSRQNSTSPR